MLKLRANLIFSKHIKYVFWRNRNSTQHENDFTKEFTEISLYFKMLDATGPLKLAFLLKVLWDAYNLIEVNSKG